MPHQCVHCGKMYPDAAKELLIGCSCSSHFFYYIKKEIAEQILKKQEESDSEEDAEKIVEEISVESYASEKKKEEHVLIQEKIEQLNKEDKKKIEKDVREIMGITEDEEIPVILDLESIRILKPGKYEIDIVNLFNKKRPLIYQLEKGKYIIDLASTIKLNSKNLEETEKEI